MYLNSLIRVLATIYISIVSLIGAAPDGYKQGPDRANQPPPRMENSGPGQNDVGVFRIDDAAAPPQSRADGKTEPLAQVHTFSRAGVASVVYLQSGDLLAAFQWFPLVKESFDKIAVSRSKDKGKTWSPPVTAQISGTGVEECAPFDPTLVELEDGRIRLYITRNASHDFSKSIPHIGSAISTDGQNFTIEPGMRFAIAGEPVIDCAAARLGGIWHLISPIQAPKGNLQRPDPSAITGKAYHATSTDGLNFTRVADLAIPLQGSWLGTLVATDGNLRFYGTGRGGIWCARSSDGEKWIVDKQTISIRGADPGVALLPSGEMLIVATVGKPQRPDPAMKGR